MDQIKKLYASLTLAQKIGLAAVLAAIALGIPAFTRWEHERDFRPLFTNMAPEDAAAIVQHMKEGGVEHRLSDNGSTVLVPAEKVDEVRLELAGVGLPKTGRIGFELFDKTNIGVTDFGEKVNYRRALEGELERSIKFINSIESARVHISFPKDSVFLDAREPAKASVLVKLRPGSTLQPQNVAAISNLVGSAVEGLSPDSVSVVDMQGNLLSRRRKLSEGPDGGDALLEYRHEVEKDLTSKVQATLEPLLGESRFRVGVSADCDISSSEQTDETYDPTRSVMASSQKSEDVSNSAAIGGAPGTASNLPRSTIKTGSSAGGGLGASRRTESISFETSRTVKQVKTPRGSVRRISAAILLDQEVQWQGQGKNRKRLLIPAPPERVKAIHDIVAGVLGLQPERGDQVVIESLPFEQTRGLGDPAEESKPAPPPQTGVQKLLANRTALIGGGVGVLLLIAVLVFLLRRKGGKKEAPSVDSNAALHAAPPHGDAVAAAPAAASARQVSSASPALPVIDNATRILLTNIQDHVAKDPQFAAGVVRGWMEED